MSATSAEGMRGIAAGSLPRTRRGRIAPLGTLEEVVEGCVVAYIDFELVAFLLILG